MSADAPVLPSSYQLASRQLIGEHGINFDFQLPHVLWMPQTVPFPEHAYAWHVGLLGA